MRSTLLSFALLLCFQTAQIASCAEPSGTEGPEPVIATPLVRVDRTPVAGGGELLTWFGRLPDRHAGGVELPLVSILRDTLGDEDRSNDRTRYVWAFGYSRPTLWQRVSAAVPFLYRRAGLDRRKNVDPTPLIDLAAPTKGLLPKVASAAAQSSVLDPLGMVFRTSARAYRGRSAEYRSMFIYRSIAVLRGSAPETGSLPPEELAKVQGRLVLSNQLLGPLVSESRVAKAWTKLRMSDSFDRGHNWELLRQKAEDNGLFFQPLRLGTEDPNFAILWVRQDSPERPFDGKFLAISDPYRDDRVRNWRGYTETWQFDASGERAATAETGSQPARMIPLGLYALDHPRVPLLMIDFRSPGKLKRREMAMRITDDVTTGVLGLTGWGNWPYMAAKSGWFFVHGRRGAPMNRSARVRAYEEFRQALLMDRSLPEPLHKELVRAMDRLGWNTFEEGIEREVHVAEAQYQALLRRASGPLARDLDRGREREIRAQIHSPRARFGLRAVSIATLGIIRHHDAMTSERLVAVAAQRREKAERQNEIFLGSVPPLVTAPQTGGQ